MNYRALLEDETVLKGYCEYIDHEVIPELKMYPWSHRKSSPKDAGIYLIYKDDELVYVGETSNIYDRLTHHENGNGSALKEKIHDYSGVEPYEYLQGCLLRTFVVKLGRLEVEKYLIDKYNPVFNNYKLRKRYRATNIWGKCNEPV